MNLSKFKNGRKAEYMALILAMLIWSVSYIWSKQALAVYHPINIILFRLIISSAILFPYLKIKKKIQPIRKADRKLIFAIAFCEPFIYYIGETFGIEMLSPTVAAVIIGTLPLFTPFAAALFLNDKLSVLNLLGVFISLGGILFLTVSPGADFFVTGKGLAFLFLSVFAGVLFSVLIKNVGSKYSVLNVIMYQNIIGIFLFLPLFFVMDFKAFISVGIVWEAFLPIVELGVFATTMAYSLYTFSLKRMNVSKANVFTNIIPVFTILFSYLFLKQSISEQKMIGIFIVIVGVFVSQMNINVKTVKYGYIRRVVVKPFKRNR